MARPRRANARPAEARSDGPLGRYRAKRDFARTPEPPGSDAGAAGRRFVVQKHAARRLHYDLRLELGRVYKSWAVTRGPSLDPDDKRLAVQVEDHPLDYGAFEGTIPKGQYGGGTVMVWDEGTWAADGDAAAGYARGRLKFRLAGEKLRGAWMLVRMPDRGERQEPWLLLKERDAFASPGGSGLPDDDVSVQSGRSMAEIAAGAAPARVLPKGAGVLPRFVPPQLASVAAEPPTGPSWLFEVKHDGYRCQLRVEGGRCTVRTRGAHDWTSRFPGIAAAAAALPVATAILDGEAVVLDERGVSSFALLRRALEAGGGAIVLYAFDLLHLDGMDLRGQPLEERKRRLAALLPEPGILRYSEHVPGRGPELFRHACRLGAEGLIAKLADQPYRSGRGTGWLKVKCERRAEVVIGGFTPVRGRTGGLGALLVGSRAADGGLLYAGKVGTGWDSVGEAGILAALERLRRPDMPFERVPAAMRRGVRWVEPAVVAEVRFQEWTPDGMLRHARWLGMREDRGQGSAPSGRGARLAVGRVRLSHPERLVLADPPTTKAEVWTYYATVADQVLAAIAGRPLSVIRCPSGAEGGCFFQRHLMPGMPKAIRPARVAGVEGEQEYFAVDDLEGLLGLVQFGAVELHPWGARADRPDRPDRLVFDLDPAEGLGWDRVTAAALGLRERLRALGLESFARTTGGKGLHVVAPIERRHGWAAAKRFARGVARAMAADGPDRFTANLAKAARKGRIFVDYLRNEDGATAVASYSLRVRAGARVAMPVAWDEVTAGLDPSKFTLASVPARLAAGPDPWAGMAELRQRLPTGA